MFKMIIDYGKPYEEDFKTIEEVRAKMLELGEMVENEELPYCEFEIEEDGRTLTDEEVDKIIL